MEREGRDPPDERDSEDARTNRPQRATRPPTDRLGSGDKSDAVNSSWRGDRATGRSRRTQALPFSRQEFALWLQDGGWRFLLAGAAIVVIATILIILSQPSRALPTTAGAEPTIGPRASILPLQATVTPLISPTLVLAAPQPAGGGAQFRVTGTGSEGLFLRPGPNRDNPALKTLPEGTVVTIIGNDSSGPDGVWKHVRDPDGSEGWLFSEFLKPVQ